MKPRLGRPPKYDETMDRRVTIRCDAKKHKEIRRAADDEGITMTGLVEKAVEQYLNRREGYLKRGRAMSK